MQVIELDGSPWKSVLDFHEALLAALGAPRWHGRSVDALIDSMIWGGINDVEPPYVVTVRGIEKAPAEVRAEVELVRDAIARARRAYCATKAQAIDVQFHIDG